MGNWGVGEGRGKEVKKRAEAGQNGQNDRMVKMRAKQTQGF